MEDLGWKTDQGEENSHHAKVIAVWLVSDLLLVNHIDDGVQTSLMTEVVDVSDVLF